MSWVGLGVGSRRRVLCAPGKEIRKKLSQPWLSANRSLDADWDREALSQP